MTSESPWDLSAIVPLLLEFRNERNWEQFHRPKELAAAISIEAAELQELFLWKEGECARDIRIDEERRKEISNEIADILIYAIYLANDMGIELNKAILKKIEENRKRY
jgi:NTP pyrophosphatase (non-canonical NTP hydrolase)